MTAIRNKPMIKFLRTRLLLDDARSLLKGWYFQFVSPENRLPRDAEAERDEIVLSEIRILMQWKEELQDLNYGRFHNMNLGCRIVNGTVIPPGRIFSLRKFLKGATEEMGFMPGPMFVRGRTIHAAGGSACLISTLLFNVALQANMDILEKHNHSADMWGEERFIDLGLDATYVYGRKDLKFRNTHSADIRILAEMSGYELHCRLVSDKPLAGTTTVRTKLLRELHPAGAPSETSPAYRKGWIVATERSFRDESGTTGTTYYKEEKYAPFFLS
jgi:Uncharacterized vancomycin resistance protein